MRSRFAILTLLCALSTAVLGQEATTSTETSATCCSIRVYDFRVAQTGDNATVVVQWVRSDATVSQERGFYVDDGVPADDTDNFLWGTGLASQPFGLMRRYTAAATEETGPLKQRANKAVLRWLRTTGRIGAAEITIP
jgi:hypothetical protein